MNANPQPKHENDAFQHIENVIKHCEIHTLTHLKQCGCESKHFSVAAANDGRGIVKVQNDGKMVDVECGLSKTFILGSRAHPHTYTYTHIDITDRSQNELSN